MPQPMFTSCQITTQWACINAVFIGGRLLCPSAFAPWLATAKSRAHVFCYANVSILRSFPS
eukprot:4798545-Amphidinium_carterae.1